jgi:hypothetical protein
MRFHDACNPTEEELRVWAADDGAVAPMQDWDLVLSWRMEPGFLGLCVELASDPVCPQAGFFLLVLYQWVAVSARGQNFEPCRSMYDRWLDKARGTANPAVKRWHHRARLLFQGIEPFEWNEWWALWRQEQTN